MMVIPAARMAELIAFSAVATAADPMSDELGEGGITSTEPMPSRDPRGVPFFTLATSGGGGATCGVPEIGTGTARDRAMPDGGGGTASTGRCNRAIALVWRAGAETGAAAAIFAGWRDMNDYMRENKIEAVPPVLVAKAAAEGRSAEAKSGDKAADAEGDKPSGPPTRIAARRMEIIRLEIRISG